MPFAVEKKNIYQQFIKEHIMDMVTSCIISVKKSGLQVTQETKRDFVLMSTIFQSCRDFLSSWIEPVRSRE